MGGDLVVRAIMGGVEIEEIIRLDVNFVEIINVENKKVTVIRFSNDFNSVDINISVVRFNFGSVSLLDVIEVITEND